MIMLIVGVIVFKADIGFLSIGLAALLMIARVSDAEEAIKNVPWGVIIMVCGVSTLIGVMEKTGGLDIVISMLAKISNPMNVTAIIALISGILSSYSSSSGVVMPTLIPLVPGLIEKIGGGNPIALIASINVGSHVVDVSPLSTLGALSIAHTPKHENKNRLFHRLFLFGLSMSLFGAVVCYIFFGLLGNYYLR